MHVVRARAEEEVMRFDRVIFSGTRALLSPDDEFFVAERVRRYAALSREVAVGDCPTGVDALVRRLVPHARVFMADWNRLDTGAGPERNRQLVLWAAEVEDYTSRALVAFPGPRSTGTWDCVRRAAAAHVRAIVDAVGARR